MTDTRDCFAADPLSPEAVVQRRKEKAKREFAAIEKRRAAKEAKWEAKRAARVNLLPVSNPAAWAQAADVAALTSEADAKPSELSAQEEKVSSNTPVVSGELATLDASLPGKSAESAEILFVVTGDLAKDVAQFKVLDGLVHERTGKVFGHIRQARKCWREEVLPLLDIVQTFLSQAGSMYGVVRDLPGWTEWYESYGENVSFEVKSLRQVQRELKQLRESNDGDGDGNPADDEEATEETPETPVVTNDPAELLREHVKEVKSALSDTSINDDQRIARVLELTENLELAINDGLLDSPVATVTPETQEVYARMAPLLLHIKHLISVLSFSFNSIERIREACDVKFPKLEFEQQRIEMVKIKLDSVVSIRDPKGLVTKMIKEGIALRGSWVCFHEPSGDRVDCLVIGKEIGDDHCTKVRRVKAGEGYTATADDKQWWETVKSELGAPKDDETYVPIPLPKLADMLMGIADESRCAHYLDGLADEIDAIAERIQDRDVLDKRMEKLEERIAKHPQHAVSARYLFKELRRDRRHQDEMRLILKAGGTTYRGQKILGDDDPYIWRYTREEIKVELKGDRSKQLGAPSVWRPTAAERVAARNQDETGPEPEVEESPVVALPEAEPESMEQREANALVTIEPTTESIGIPGCSYIYAPAGQAGEYAPLAANPYRGCGHCCSYCYVPLICKMKRTEFDAAATPRADFLNKLRRDAKKYQQAGVTEQVLFSFTTDVYNPLDCSLTRPSLLIVQDHGLAICVLTKGGSRALEDIDLYRPDRDCFASTLTSLDAAFAEKWERNAALPDDRIATLKAFHDRGIFTWVSLEPTLDVESSLAIVETTHEFVNLFKIGRANYLGEYTKTTDWEDYTHRMIALCGKLGVAHYIKRDLQQYLPDGYHNPLRVKQHHGAESLSGE